MKNLIIVTSACLLIGIFAFTPRPVDSFGEIGNVKYSLLPPDLFIKQNGPGWVLMDDQVVLQGSVLESISGMKTVPDARGMFIRGLNLTRDGNTGDPFEAENGRQRVAGDFQWDAIQYHTHTVSHDVGTPAKDNLIDGYHDLYCIAQRDSWKQSDSYSTGGPNVTANHNSEETRPRNIALYVYVKINLK